MSRNLIYRNIDVWNKLDEEWYIQTRNIQNFKAKMDNKLKMHMDAGQYQTNHDPA